MFVMYTTASYPNPAQPVPLPVPQAATSFQHSSAPLPITLKNMHSNARQAWLTQQHRAEQSLKSPARSFRDKFHDIRQQRGVTPLNIDLTHSVRPSSSRQPPIVIVQDEPSPVQPTLCMMFPCKKAHASARKAAPSMPLAVPAGAVFNSTQARRRSNAVSFPQPMAPVAHMHGPMIPVPSQHYATPLEKTLGVNHSTSSYSRKPASKAVSRKRKVVDDSQSCSKRLRLASTDSALDLPPAHQWLLA